MDLIKQVLENTDSDQSAFPDYTNLNQTQISRNRNKLFGRCRIYAQEKYQYALIKGKGGVLRRKLQLVKCTTKAGKIFHYFNHHLQSFPAVSSALTGRKQHYKSLTESLPMNHAVRLHDFSQNNKCVDKAELHSSYYQQPEVSVHVSIVHRHAVFEYDGVVSSEVEPFFFAISHNQQYY